MLTQEEIKYRAVEIAKMVKRTCGEGELLQEVIKRLSGESN